MVGQKRNQCILFAINAKSVGDESTYGLKIVKRSDRDSLFLKRFLLIVGCMGP